MSAGSEQAAADMLEPVRRHFRDSSYEFQVGPGWLELVLRCHQAVVAEFPQYELLAVKQKWGSLAFEAFPRPWKRGGDWTEAEHSRLCEVIDTFSDLSESICERCGRHGSLRESRPITLTLCGECELLVPAHGSL